jgi:hypothetical protein
VLSEVIDGVRRRRCRIQIHCLSPIQSPAILRWQCRFIEVNTYASGRGGCRGVWGWEWNGAGALGGFLRGVAVGVGLLGGWGGVDGALQNGLGVFGVGGRWRVVSLVGGPASPRGARHDALFNSEAGHPISSVFGFSDIARVPLTQRAFRSPAGARVTFLLLAQKKSNPKKMAFRARAPQHSEGISQNG